jgi:hypothetical protein
VGGAPDLPKGVAWPSDDDGPLAFVAQLNFAECSSFDESKTLPDKGVLYLFCSYDEEMLSDHEPPAAILFHAGPLSALARAKFPANLDSTEGRLQERRMTFSESFILVDIDDDDDIVQRLRMDQLDEEAVAKMFAQAGCLTDAYLLGLPLFHRSELKRVFDRKADVLLLNLPADQVWRPGDSGSIFGEGKFMLMLSREALEGRQFDETLLVFEGGS